MGSVRLTHRRTGSVVVVPEEKVAGLVAHHGYVAEDKPAAKKAPAKKAASGKSEK